MSPATRQRLRLSGGTELAFITMSFEFAREQYTGGHRAAMRSRSTDAEGVLPKPAPGLLVRLSR